MKKRQAAVAAILVAAACMAVAWPVRAQHLAEPGIPPGVQLINISKGQHDQYNSVFPMVTVSRGNPDLVAVAWRRWALPFDTDSPNFDAECHVAISHNGGHSFTDTNLMRYLRTAGGPNPPYESDADGVPHLKGCNAPYAAIANDGSIYAGGAVYTTVGSTPAAPRLKPGRIGISVSKDGGASWSKIKVGIRLDNLAPGMTGLNGGMDPNPDTPWDGAGGVVDPQTGTFYTSSGGRYIAATDDKAETFGTVYQSKGTPFVSFGTVIAANTVQDFANAQCPCLVVATSTDKGKDWANHLVAQAGQYDPTGQTRYAMAAANPAKAGSYVVGTYAPDHRSVQVYYTNDFGVTWKMAVPQPIPASIIFTTVKQVGVGYTSDGNILVTWRAWRNVAAHNSFVAMMSGDSFGPTVKLTPELSIDPPSSFDTWYNGDFTNSVAGNKTDAFVAFVFAPKGQNEDTWLARVPLSLLR